MTILAGVLAACVAVAPSPSPAPAAGEELPALGSPRGAVYGYLTEARRADFEAASRFLDLSGVPVDDREERGPILARHLKAVLDQNLWFDLHKVSNRPEGNPQDGLPENVEQIGSIRASGALVDVVLVRVTVKDEGLVWKFSPTLVDRIPELYREFGFGWIGEHVPPWLHRMRYLGLELWQWLGLLVAVVGGAFVSFATTRVFIGVLRPIAGRTRFAVDDQLIETLRRPFRWTLWTLIFAVSVSAMHVSVRASSWLTRVIVALAFVAAIRIVAGISEAYARAARLRLEREGHRSGAGVVNVVNRAVKAVLACIAVIGLMQALGFNVTGLLAGLGIGGVALALAAQKTVENLFGGLTVMADKPVKIGDFCRFGDKSGWVEDIGFRSTRIRTPERTVLSVPNAEFSAVQIENFADRDRSRFFTILSLRYETTPDQLRAVLTSLRALFLGHPKVSRDQLRVRFSALGPSSLDVEINAYVITADVAEFQAIREDLLLRILDAVTADGTGFAFPSRTVYVRRDAGIDAERARAAEASIAALRSRGKLPFPDPTREEIEELTDRIDYPPEGSSSAPPPVATS